MSQTCYKANPKVRCRFLREWGVAVAYSPDIRAMVAMDPLCYLIWKLCNKARSVEELSSIVVGWLQDSCASRETAHEHVRLALDMLASNRLILREDDHEGPEAGSHA